MSKVTQLILVLAFGAVCAVNVGTTIGSVVQPKFAEINSALTFANHQIRR